jgi:hypothetical protein
MTKGFDKIFKSVVADELDSEVSGLTKFLKLWQEVCKKPENLLDVSVF